MIAKHSATAMTLKRPREHQRARGAREIDFAA
jgi:hypothetical protein